MGRKKKVAVEEEVKPTVDKVIEKEEPKKSWFEAMQDKMANKK
jgi:hypothetical protein